MSPIRIAIVGVGKIVRDQHAPVLRASKDFEIVATASPHSRLEDVPAYKTLDELLKAEPQVDAVTVSTSSDVRHDIALEALRAGKHVLLEKPPCTTITAVDDLRSAAELARVTLFASWHSRFAPHVQAARAWLASRQVRSVEVIWREDVRRWHPGQAWVWEPGGLGVFDPGVNALATLTEIIPSPIFLVKAELSVPANKQTPISAQLAMATDAGAPIRADFDWTGQGEQTWEIRVETGDGRLRLYEGGAALAIDDRAVSPVQPEDSAHAEYIGVYARFAELIRSRGSEVDDRPLRLAADAFFVGRRSAAPEFQE